MKNSTIKQNKTKILVLRTQSPCITFKSVIEVYADLFLFNNTLIFFGFIPGTLVSVQFVLDDCEEGHHFQGRMPFLM